VRHTLRVTCVSHPVHVACYTVSHIYVNRYSVDTGWGSRQNIDGGTSSAVNPKIAFDGSGNAIAVWRQQNGLVQSNR
jgi:hypothetical protein